VEAIQHLQLCRDIVYHLLPRGLREEVTNTIRNTTVLLSDFNQRSAALETFVHAYAKGTIDYTQHQDTLRALLKGMERKVVCQISYQSKKGNPPKKYLIAPMRLIAYHEGLYLKARFEESLETPGKLHDPLFLIHRILKVELTTRKYQIEKNGNGTQSFGLMAGKPFSVRAAFSPAAAQYVSERKWSDDQQIQSHSDGSIILEFTSTSGPEVISWILSFGPEANLLSPEPLRQTISEKISAMAGVYDHH
jgi:predicted DNA-binding transcriptional regulator YafY